MKKIITLLIIIAGFTGLNALEPANNSTFDSIGHMPEIVVTAPRYENEDDAWSGLMPEIIATAPRYDAYSGLTDTIYVTASRYEDTDIGHITMIGQTKPNTPGSNNKLFQPGMNNLDNNQSFSGDINSIICLVMMSLIIGLFMLLYYLRKKRRPAKVVCYCEKRIR